MHYPPYDSTNDKARPSPETREREIAPKAGLAWQKKTFPTAGTGETAVNTEGDEGVTYKSAKECWDRENSRALHSESINNGIDIGIGALDRLAWAVKRLPISAIPNPIVTFFGPGVELPTRELVEAATDNILSTAAYAMEVGKYSHNIEIAKAGFNDCNAMQHLA